MSSPGFRTRRLRAFLRVDEAHDSFHPLHVGIWRDLAYKFFGSDTESLATLKLDRISSSSSSLSPTEACSDSTSRSSSLFVTAFLVDSLEFVTTEDRLELLCSRRFLSHFRFGDGDAVAVRPVVAFPLRRLSLTTKNESASKWLRSVVDRGDLRAALCIGGVASRRRLVARKGDVLPLPTKSAVFANDAEFRDEFLDGVFVLDCDPIHQGIVDVDTAINVVEDKTAVGSTPANTIERAINATASSPSSSSTSSPLSSSSPFSSSSSPLSSSSSSSIVLRPRVISSLNDFRRRLRNLNVEASKSSSSSSSIPFYDDLRTVVVSSKCGLKLLGDKLRMNSFNGWA